MRGKIKYDRTNKPRYFLDRGGILGFQEVTKREYEREFPDQPIGAPGGQPLTGWPLVSDALSVHPNQVKAANERARRHGINVHYNRKGQAVIPSRHERKKLLRLEQFHDKSGGYGD